MRRPGFFSVDAAGDIVYLNATLASWLDHDLAQVGAGSLKLNDIVAGEGAALLTTLNAAPGEVKTEVLDLDLKTRGGKPVPVRLFHKVAFGADGAPGTSRTLVLNRARDAEATRSAPLKCGSCASFRTRRWRLPRSTKPVASRRSNARFATAFEGLLKSDDRSILSVIVERERPVLEAAIRKAAEGQSDIAPVEAALTGSAERWANFFVLAVDEEDRDGEAAIVYALETTAQRTLENRIQQQQKMELVGQLGGGIAHDFNNVLSAIMMATDFLLNAHKPTDPSFKDIMQIKQNANRAAALVRQLLAFSRKQTLRPQVLDLGETLSDLGMLLKRLIGEKVTLEIVHGRDLWPVKVDISQFEQVIVNLAVNARDAMADGGKLTLRTTNVSAEDCAKFAYKGMPKARLRPGRGERYRDRHSDRYYREDLRTVFHHQRSRQRHRARPFHRVRDCQTDGWIYLRGFGAWPHLIPDISATPCSGRRGGACAISLKRRRRQLRAQWQRLTQWRAAATADLPGRARSCWSRMRKVCVRLTRADWRRAATRYWKPATASRLSRLSTSTAASTWWCRTS